MNDHSWGLHVGNYSHGNRYNIPVILSTEKGGFCLNYSKKDQQLAENFIENTILNFAAHVKIEHLEIHLWDCAIHKRFPYLSEIGKWSKFYLSQNPESIEDSFNLIEGLLKTRHKQLLDIHNPTLSIYNENHPHKKQPYHLLLINGDDYPNEKSSLTRWQYFFQAAAKAGIFIVMFTTKESFQAADTDAWTWLKRKLPTVSFKDQEWHFSPESFAHQSLRDWYQFQPLNIDKKKLLTVLAEKKDYSPFPLLGENFAEYNDLIKDVISDLQKAEEDKFLNEDIKNRLIAAAQHHQENMIKRETARRDRLRIETERLERLLEIKRQEEEVEKRYLAFKEARKLEELAIQKREEAEKVYYQQQIKKVYSVKIFLNILLVISFLSLVFAFAIPNLYDYQHLSKISAYFSFSAIVFFLIFYMISIFTFSDSYYQSILKRSIAYHIYVMLAVNSLIFSSFVVLILYNIVGGDIDKFILLSLVNIAAFFIIVVSSR